MAEIAMPQLSDSMEQGTILKWLKSDGDEVSEGEELVEIETDKANMTYEADQSGVLQIVAKEGDTLPVGATIAKIGEGAASNGRTPEAETEDPEADEAGEPDAGGAEGTDAEDTEAEETESEPDADEPEPEAAPTPAPAARDGDSGDVKASPVARRMARELGVALGAVEGSGPGGRIVKGDVEAAAKGGEAAPAHQPPPQRKPAQAPAEQAGTAKGTTETQELSKLQQVVARRMAESKATAPEFLVSVEVDMEEAVATRDHLKALAREGDTVPSFNDFVVKASALALRDYPRANGAYRDGRFELYSRVNVGVAVAGQDALVVPTVFDADRKSLGQIGAEVRALAEKVRDGTVTPPELSGGTFTVSNLGMYGMHRIVPVINPPQAAILGVGAMEPRPVVRDGRIMVRPLMDLTLVCDHRILYGADAAQFLGRIKELLEQPLRLAL